MIQPVEKKCPECGSRFHGRSDKKFCSDYCRSTFNNRKKEDSSVYVKRINSILRRNRKILNELNASGRKRIVLHNLKLRGFDLNYFTSMLVSPDGETFYYCYEHAYAIIDRELAIFGILEEQEAYPEVASQ